MGFNLFEGEVKKIITIKVKYIKSKGDIKVLILPCKIGESIVIEKNIYILVLGINGNQVRLGIDAPKAISIGRADRHPQIKKECGVYLFES